MRFLWYRDTGPFFTFSRLQQVEHEALITLLARDAGVAAPAILLAATTGEDDAALVTEHRGTSLGELDAEAISDEALEALWQEVALLHGAAMSHGSLDAEHVYLDGAGAILTGFQAGSLTATPAAIGTDVAELLVSLAVLVGVERSVGTASQGLGNESLAEVVSYLQLPAISSTTRKAADKPKKLVKSVQAEVVAVTGVEEPESVELRRIGVGSLVTTGLLIFAVYFMLQQLAGTDSASTWEAIQTATWVWVLAGFIVGQTLLLPGATSFMAAVTAPIPLKPTMVLQSAIQFVNIAVPSAAGRIATNVAYLHKFGVGPVAALTQAALDSFTLFLVQVAILLIAFMFGSLDFGISRFQPRCGTRAPHSRIGHRRRLGNSLAGQVAARAGALRLSADVGRLESAQPGAPACDCAVRQQLCNKHGPRHHHVAHGAGLWDRGLIGYCPGDSGFRHAPRWDGSRTGRCGCSRGGPHGGACLGGSPRGHRVRFGHHVPSRNIPSSPDMGLLLASLAAAARLRVASHCLSRRPSRLRAALGSYGAWLKRRRSDRYWGDSC